MLVVKNKYITAYHKYREGSKMRRYKLEEYVIASLKKSGIKVENYSEIEKIEVSTLDGTRIKLKKLEK